MEKKSLRQPTLTVGELCRAIAEGQLHATLQNNEWYQVSAREVRRLINQQQPAPILAAPYIMQPLKS
jgi:hypothetical protein